jgi:predicted DNA-binding transcriptional regulator YafY
MAQPSQQIIVLTRTDSCVDRRFKLKCMFLEGGSYTVAELAERFGVAQNTIGRDLRALSARYGVPLICEVRWRMMDEN